MKKNKRSIAKLIIVALIVCFSMTFFTTTSKAFDSNIQIEKLSDGSYFETIIIEEPNTRTSNTKSATKTVNYKNSKGSILWTVSVHGTFTYTGSSSKCTLSTVSTNIYDSNWKITSKSSSKSGNKAIAKATTKLYQSGVAIQTVSKTVTLTCSANGNMS